MIINRKSFLMNEEGASPGGGAIPPAPASPAANAGAPQAPAFDPSVIKTAVSEAFGELRNGLFADLRKAGALKQEKAPAEAAPQTQDAKAPGAPGLSSADVEAMLERERVITARATKHELTDAQVKRMKSALGGVSVDVFAREVDSYMTEMGLVKAPTAATAATTATPVTDPPKPAAAAPAAPSAHALPTANGVVDLFNLSNPQLASLGPQGVRENLEKLWAQGNQMSGAPQRPKPPSQR